MNLIFFCFQIVNKPVYKPPYLVLSRVVQIHKYFLFNRNGVVVKRFVLNVVIDNELDSLVEIMLRREVFSCYGNSFLKILSPILRVIFYYLIDAWNSLVLCLFVQPLKSFMDCIAEMRFYCLFYVRYDVVNVSKPVFQLALLKRA